MTREDLSCLDEDLKCGYMSDEDYVQTLKDEVARVHPEFEDFEIDNMIRLQLRANAIEESLLSEVDEDVNEQTSINAASSEGQECQAKRNEAQEDEAHNECQGTNCEQTVSNGNEEKDCSNAQEQKQESSKHSSDDDAKQNQSDSNYSKDDDQNSDNDQKNQSEKSNNNSSNQMWLTYQIVPEWVLFGNNKERDLTDRK